jgi:hypothetical protein
VLVGIEAIIIASIIGLDIAEGDMAFDMGLVEDMDIIGLLVIDIIGLEAIDIIGLEAIDIIGLEAIDIIGFVDDIVIIGSVDNAIAGFIDIIALRAIMFLANLDIIERTDRIVGDVVII